MYHSSNKLVEYFYYMSTRNLPFPVTICTFGHRL